MPAVGPPEVLVILGVVTALLALPLLLGLVRPNRVYGIRVREAFASERNWYVINAFGAKRLILFGAVVASIGYLLEINPQAPFWLPILGLLFALAMLVVTVRSIARHARMLSGRA